MNKKVILIFLISFVGISAILFFYQINTKQSDSSKNADNRISSNKSNFFSIAYLKSRSYPGSDIKIEEILEDGVNYKRYIASYKSDGLKIYGLLTVPGDAVKKGWPAIIFLHGYLDPKVYEATERYVQYQDAFASAGYVTFKPDLRGHGKSEGQPVNSNFSEAYVVDALNALASVQKHKGVNEKKIGMWGHSNGGGITLRSIVSSKQIKAAVIWSGVVGDFQDLLERYRKRISWMNNPANAKLTTDSDSLKEADSYNFLENLSAPVQLHHGELDESVPPEFSKHLYSELKKLNKKVELYTYPDSDHNIAQDYELAMLRSVEFFDKYLK